MHLIPASDEQRVCPICFADNHCGVDRSGGCWCFHEIIPARLLDEIQKDWRMTACICIQCVLAFKGQNATDPKIDGIP
jgi:hypothetical protein